MVGEAREATACHQVGDRSAPPTGARAALGLQAASDGHARSCIPSSVCCLSARGPRPPAASIDDGDDGAPIDHAGMQALNRLHVEIRREPAPSEVVFQSLAWVFVIPYGPDKQRRAVVMSLGATPGARTARRVVAVAHVTQLAAAQCLCTAALFGAVAAFSVRIGRLCARCLSGWGRVQRRGLERLAQRPRSFEVVVRERGLDPR